MISSYAGITMNIIEVTLEEDLIIARKLFIEYQEMLNVDLCFQGFEKELATLPGKYASPTGSILLAEYKSKIVGCVAVRALRDDICEMKRLYVRNEFQGLSAGRKLAEAVIAKAKILGYQKMQLDTLQRLDRAIALYEKLGFKEIKPYYANPLEEVVYWELDLTAID